MTGLIIVCVGAMIVGWNSRNSWTVLGGMMIALGILLIKLT